MRNKKRFCVRKRNEQPTDEYSRIPFNQQMKQMIQILIARRSRERREEPGPMILSHADFADSRRARLCHSRVPSGRPTPAQRVCFLRPSASSACDNQHSACENTFRVIPSTSSLSSVDKISSLAFTLVCCPRTERVSCV